jgi:hypothetical protein
MKKGNSIKIIKQQFIFNRSLIIFTLSMFLIVACVEPYQGDIPNFDDVLVVNAILTNENKTQKLTLTRSYRFEEDGPQAETNAHVLITTDGGLEFAFEETKPGTYESLQPFAAEMQKSYTLLITTANGNNYSSKPMQLPVSSTSIDKVYAERITNDNGEEGMAIYVDSFDPTGNSKYYRHDYIETFKIIAPYWSPYDVFLIGEGELQDYFAVILREREERVCYGTNNAKDIVIASTNGLIEDRLKKHNIRFVNRDDYMLSYRYSILVKQYVQTPETFSYYETLKGLSQSSNNIFSEDQPGFLAGNIFSIDDPSENIAGFFEVSTVAEKRLFFNYEDFFPNEDLPPYVTSCFLEAPTSEGFKGERDQTNVIKSQTVRFYDFNTNQIPGGGGFLLVKEECGDCTTLGSNKVPDFWEE